MDPDLAIHQLGNVQVDSYAGQRVSVVPAQVFLGNEKINHVANGHPGGSFQIFIEPHGDITRRRFRLLAIASVGLCEQRT